MTATAGVHNGTRRTAADALAERGFTGDRLLRLARKIANDELGRRGAFLDQSRFEDLVSFLTLAGANAALRYDPQRYHASYGRNGGEPFASWLADVLSHRVTDWYRSKSEGNGDASYGHDRRVVLSPMDDEVDVDGLDFENLISERRLVEWQQAASAVDLPMAEWVMVTLDRAA